MSVLIAPTLEGDIAKIVAISNWAAVHTPANFATEPEPEAEWLAAFRATRAWHPWLTARDEATGEIVGFAKAAPHRARGAYRWTAEVSVYVAPTHHRQGIGTALYARLLPTLNAQGYLTLIAGITLPNPGSVRLHESFGFVRCATYHRVGWKFDRWHDVGYWELPSSAERPGELRRVIDIAVAPRESGL